MRLLWGHKDLPHPFLEAFRRGREDKKQAEKNGTDYVRQKNDGEVVPNSVAGDLGDGIFDSAGISRQFIKFTIMGRS